MEEHNTQQYDCSHTATFLQRSYSSTFRIASGVTIQYRSQLRIHSTKHLRSSCVQCLSRLDSNREFIYLVSIFSVHKFRFSYATTPMILFIGQSVSRRLSFQLNYNFDVHCWYNQEVTGHFVAVLGIARIEQAIPRSV